MYFKLGKHIFLHKTFLLLPIVIFLHGEFVFYLVMLVSAFLHETAHLVTAICFKEMPDKFFISPYGFELRIASAAPECETAILLSGPALSFVLAAAGFYLGFENIFRANLYLFALNILPAYPLDGGKLLKIALWHIWGVYRGNKILRKISYVSAVILCAAAAYFASVWLFIVAFLITARTKTLRGTPFYRKRKRFTPVKTFSAAPSATVLEALRLFSPYYYTCIYIGEKDTLLTERDIVTLLENCEYNEKFDKILSNFPD